MPGMGMMMNDMDGGLNDDFNNGGNLDGGLSGEFSNGTQLFDPNVANQGIGGAARGGGGGGGGGGLGPNLANLMRDPKGGSTPGGRMGGRKDTHARDEGNWLNGIGGSSAPLKKRRVATSRSNSGNLGDAPGPGAGLANTLRSDSGLTNTLRSDSREFNPVLSPTESRDFPPLGLQQLSSKDFGSLG